MNLAISIIVHEAVKSEDAFDVHWCTDCFPEKPTPPQHEQLAATLESLAQLLRSVPLSH